MNKIPVKECQLCGALLADTEHARKIHTDWHSRIAIKPVRRHGGDSVMQGVEYTGIGRAGVRRPPVPLPRRRFDHPSLDDDGFPVEDGR